MIKNAITYHVEMPSAEDVLDFTHEYMAKKPGHGEIVTAGFAKHPVMGDIISEFGDAYCITVLRWEKKLNATAINHEVKEHVELFHHRYGRKATRKEKLMIKDEIIVGLLPDILPTPKYLFAYYLPQTNTLIVDSSSSKDADCVTSLLRKAIGSLKATTLYIDSRIGLTNSLKNHLSGEAAEFINESIWLGSSLELEGGGKVKYTDTDLSDDATANEICSQIIDNGMHIKSVQMISHCGSFVLSNDFKMKKIRLEFDRDDDESNQDAWMSESYAYCSFISDMTQQLVERFQVVE